MQKTNDKKNDNSELIHAHVYDPSRPSLFKTKKSEAARSFEIHCTNKDACEAYKNHQCVLRTFRIFGGSRCPYGKIKTDKGYTRRARGFRSWVSNKQEEYKDVARLSEPGGGRILEIGEFYYLPYGHLDSLGEDVKARFDSVSSSHAFILKKELTAEVLSAIITHRPQAFFGGTIRSYQVETVPGIIKDLFMFQRPLFEALKAVHPEISRYEQNDYVGRKALLKSLRPNIELFLNHKTWSWDGEYLSRTDDTAPIGLSGLGVEETIYRVKPKEEAIVEITDNSQCDENTIFI